jgi:hypothetical protein
MTDDEIEQFEKMKLGIFRRKRDGQRYQLSSQRTYHAQLGSAIRLVPIWGGRTHWKTWPRFLAEYEAIEVPPPAPIA